MSRLSMSCCIDEMYQLLHFKFLSEKNTIKNKQTGYIDDNYLRISNPAHIKITICAFNYVIYSDNYHRVSKL